MSDAGILLTKNKMKAIKRMVFRISSEAMKIGDLPDPVSGSQVNLVYVLTWMIRNLRRHKLDSKDFEVNIKLDGQPFWVQCMLPVSMKFALKVFLEAKVNISEFSEFPLV